MSKTQTGDAVLSSATKKPRQTLSEWTEKNLGAIEKIGQVGLGLAGSIATTAQQQKFQADQNKVAIQQIKSGQYVAPTTDTTGGGGGGGTPPPAAQSDTILGMSKPIFFGVLGGIIIVAGVGIYFATRGGEQAAK